jgi:ubiquinone/menaquinone biosynthesis C-methylase UbiE
MNTIPLPPIPLQLHTGPNTGDGYLLSGKFWVDEFVKLGLFNSGDTILDVGCGAGKVARFMTDKLDPDSGGEFHGFDVHGPSIQWANDAIGGVYSNFIFNHVDVYHPDYNLEGVIDPNKFVFPYDDSYFDFSYSTSLFTHMTKQSVEHYLSEIFRVCKSGGIHFATFFCFEKDVSEIEQSQHVYPKTLSKYDDVSYVMFPDSPTGFVAYVNSYLEELIIKTGFHIQHKPSSNFQAGWIFKKEELI